MGVDATSRRGLSSIQKCIAAIRIMAYGVSADVVDVYVRIGESTAMKCLKRFVKGVNKIFRTTYLRKPNAEDIARLLYIGEARGLEGDIGTPTIILEVIASQDLWIWRAFFGVAGANNHINVVNQSPVFDYLLHRRAPPVEFTLGEHQYNMGYYLTDGIYPNLAKFVKTIPRPQGEKHRLFAQHQEGARKDMEPAFGVLQARFAIVRNPARLWSKSALSKIIIACIIMHNMIVEDERDTYLHQYRQEHDPFSPTNVVPELSRDPISSFQTYRQNSFQLRNRDTYYDLPSDLIEHIWQKWGSNTR